jgi:hypothetical protein
MLFDKLARGPLMDAAADAAAAGAISPEMKAALEALVKPMLTDAINAAVKGKKNEETKGVKAVEAKMSEIIGALKPKQQKKLMKRLGLGKSEGKTAEELAAEATAAAAAAAAAAARGEKKTPTEEDLRKKQPDMYAKRAISEFEARIVALEAENKAVKQQAIDARKSSALDRALTDFPWASSESRDMARDFYLSKLQWNDEGTDLLIGDMPFAKYIAAEIPAKYENLLAPVGKGGAGTTKGTGKAGALDVDAATEFNATPAQKAEAAKFLAAQMGHN